MRFLPYLATGLIALAGPALADMSLSFSSWGDIPSCTSGRPNIVGNPQFALTGVPSSTASVEFRLKDLDAPSYNHGGAKLAMSQSGTLPFGVFTYKSPCPPGGVHTYEWTATARDGNGATLGTAKAQRRYPE